MSPALSFARQIVLSLVTVITLSGCSLAASTTAPPQKDWAASASDQSSSTGVECIRTNAISAALDMGMFLALANADVEIGSGRFGAQVEMMLPAVLFSVSSGIGIYRASNCRRYQLYVEESAESSRMTR